MRRQPPRGKPSFAPVVDLLQGLEKLSLTLAKWVPTELTLPITSAVLQETRRNVSYLVHNGAPTRAMMDIVRLAEDIGRVEAFLTDLGSKSAEVLRAAGKGRRADIRALAKFLSKRSKDVKVKEKARFSGALKFSPPLRKWLQESDDSDDDYDF